MKWIRTMVCALGMLACVSLSAFAAEYGEPNITTKTTMKELRENPSIKGSGYYTYCNEWIEGSTQYDDTPIEGYVSYAAAEDAAEGMNLVIENYNKGVQVTWQVYTPEEIAENSSLGMVQLFYYPAEGSGGRYAIVLPGNGSTITSEMEEGGSAASQLHAMGYTVFVLRYRSFLDATDNAPLDDIGRAVQFRRMQSGSAYRQKGMPLQRFPLADSWLDCSATRRSAGADTVCPSPVRCLWPIRSSTSTRSSCCIMC